MAPPFCWDALLLYSNTREVKSIGKTNANILYCESIAESTDNGKKKKLYRSVAIFSQQGSQPSSSRARSLPNKGKPWNLLAPALIKCGRR